MNTLLSTRKAFVFACTIKCKVCVFTSITYHERHFWRIFACTFSQRDGSWLLLCYVLTLFADFCFHFFSFRFFTILLFCSLFFTFAIYLLFLLSLVFNRLILVYLLSARSHTHTLEQEQEHEHMLSIPLHTTLWSIIEYQSTAHILFGTIKMQQLINRFITRTLAT